MFSVQINAQSRVVFDSTFYAHLNTKNLAIERYAYLQLLDLEDANNHLVFSDLLSLSSQYKDSTYLRSIVHQTNDTTLLEKAFFVSLINTNLNLAQFTLDKYATLSQSIENKNLLNELLHMQQGVYPKQVINDNFYTIVKQINTLQSKSVVVAALLSIIIPGLGKAYLNQKNEAVGTFTLNAIVAAPFIETSIKLGLLSVGSVLTGAVLLPVYAAGVYGTIKFKKARTNKLKEELHHEIIDYCTYRINNG